jgi:hypothetical protein
MRFLKYEIPNWETFKQVIEDKIGKDCHVVCLGQRVEGFEAVDILWLTDPLPEFEQYEVYPDPVSMHTFLGCEELYEVEFNRKMKEV